MNNINVIGRLTADPTMRTTQSGKSVLSFSIAVNSGFGENEKTDFFDISLWEDYARSMSGILTKGKQIGVTGEVHLKEFTDKSNNTYRGLEITNAQITLCGKKDDQ